MDRDSKEYELAEKIVFLESALATANKVLNDEGKLGVLPRSSVSFWEGSKHHARVRKVLNN